MTNKEKYKQAFSAIHISDDFSLEGKSMKTVKNKHKLNRLAACIALCVMIGGSATAAYAADVGGIQRTLQLWIHGDKTEAVLRLDGNGSYSMEYMDSEGNTRHQGGGGAAVSPDGTAIPVTEEELMEQLTAPDVEYEEDGSVCVYWFDQKVDITDKFENNVCYVKLVNGSDILYMTVKYQNGFATSPRKYISPSAFD